MIKIISRAPNDEFTYSLFHNLVEAIPYDYEAYYVWSGELLIFKKFISNTTFVKPNIVIGIKDLLDMSDDYDYWGQKYQNGVELIIECARNNLDKNFIIFTSLENLSAEIDQPNIQLVPWGGDITNQATLYPTVTPALDKNFNSKKHFISLNRHNRAHRIILLSYLFGQGYNLSGDISYIKQQPTEELLDHISWQFEPRHQAAQVAMNKGYQKLKQHSNLNVDGYNIYPAPNDNVSNFNDKLHARYLNTFVEIIAESSFSAPSYLITEKFLNSVYGCNFPILLSGIGAVEHLTGIGFDMFDDIVDHSYNQITNPIDRIIAAIENNKRLLVDSDYAKQLWSANQPRFKNNVDIAKGQMYTWYQTRAISKFNAVKWN